MIFKPHQRIQAVIKIRPIVIALLCGVFLWAGLSKLLSANSAVRLFESLELPQWIMRAVGALEMQGALMLLLKNWKERFAGAALLAAIMIYGAVFQWFQISTVSALPPALLALICSGVALSFWEQNLDRVCQSD